MPAEAAPAEKGNAMEIMLLIVGSWCIMIVFMILAFALTHYFSTWSYVVYDLCSSSEGSFFYSVKLKVTNLPEDLIGGAKFMTLDLLGTSGQFVTRLVVPFNEAIRDKSKAKDTTVTVTFKVGRKRRLPDIGRIRVDHELWGQQVFVHYIDIKSLNDEDGSRRFRASVNQSVTMLMPAEVDVTKYQKDQVFQTEHDINYPGGRPTVHPNLTIPEGTVFLLFAAVIVLSLTYCVPKWLDKRTAVTNDDFLRNAAINGCLSAFIGLIIGLLLMVMFKFFVKRQRTMCGLAMSGRLALFTVLLLIAVILTIVSGIVAYNGAVYAYQWFIAAVIGAILLLVIFAPIGFIFEILSRKRANGQMVREESTTQTPNSQLQTPVAGPSRA